MELKSDLFIFTDIEASGLHDGSFPIEIGWSGVDLIPHHFLIKPAASWGVDLWSTEAEKIHGISWDQLQDEGVSPEEAAERVVDAFRGKYLVSDSPGFEARWFLRLFETVDVKSDFVRRDPIHNRLLTQIKDIYDTYQFAVKIEGTGHWKSAEQVVEAISEIEECFPHTHRASDDAVQLAASFKLISDPSWDYRAAARNFSTVANMKLK